MNEQAEKNPQANPSEGRSAEKYIDAVNAVISIAGMATSYLVPGGKAAIVAGAVVKAAPFARTAAEQLPKLAPIVTPAAKKAADTAADIVPDAIANGAGKAIEMARGLAGTAGSAIDGARSTIQDAIDTRAQEKARKLARKTLLDGAGIRMSVSSFMENWGTQAQLATDQSDTNYLAYSGCYVIATYDNAVRKDDYSKYRDLYVGKSENMGKCIHADICGKGNVDVYADVKYKQHVYVLLFPCPADQLERLEESLITALDADESYNAREMPAIPQTSSEPIDPSCRISPHPVR